MVLLETVINLLGKGWANAFETWTYNSSTSFKISGDKTSKYQVGDKLKLTQTTDKFFMITNVSYSSPDTTITVNGFNLYTVANSAITNPFYSRIESPLGFPRRVVVLFNSTPAASVTLSESNANFDRILVHYTNSSANTSLFMLPNGVSTIVIGQVGLLDGNYAQRLATCSITLSGTNISCSAIGANYTADLRSNNTYVFSDAKTTLKISKVIGFRW
jgi:hypothetical protein